MLSTREVLLYRVLILLSRGLNGEIDYWNLGQEIWQVAGEMTDYEDKRFRDYLQWLECNLDSLLNLDASTAILNEFAQDQIDLITASLKDEKLLEVLEWKDSLVYLFSSSKENFTPPAK